MWVHVKQLRDAVVANDKRVPDPVGSEVFVIQKLFVRQSRSFCRHGSFGAFPEFFRGWAELFCLVCALTLGTIFESRQPPMMSVIHGRRLFDVVLDGGRTNLGLFGDDFASVVLGHNEPSMVAMNSCSSSKPSEPLIGDEFMDGAFDGKTKRFPCEFHIRF